MRVITETIESHPACADAKELRRLLNEHYPFGPRRYHPYRMWCRAVRDVIAQRFGKPKADPAPVVRIHPVRGVLCGWCDGKGCFSCFSARQKWSGLGLDVLDRWATWYPAAAKDEAERLILADWLEERGLEEEARHLRALGCVRPKKARKGQGGDNQEA